MDSPPRIAQPFQLTQTEPRRLITTKTLPPDTLIAAITPKQIIRNPTHQQITNMRRDKQNKVAQQWPDYYRQVIPMLWNEQETKALLQTNLYGALIERRKQLQKQYMQDIKTQEASNNNSSKINVVTGRHGDTTNDHPMSWEDYCIAQFVMTSRAYPRALVDHEYIQLEHKKRTREHESACSKQKRRIEPTSTIKSEDRSEDWSDQKQSCLLKDYESEQQNSDEDSGGLCLKTSSEICLIPFLDLLDHKPLHPILWKIDPITKNFEMRTIIETPAGSPVWNNYGAKSNEELLIAYGFCIERNPADTVALRLGEKTFYLSWLNPYVIPSELIEAGWDRIMSDADFETQDTTKDDKIRIPSIPTLLETLQMFTDLLENKMADLGSVDASDYLTGDALEMVNIYRTGQIELVRGATIGIQWMCHRIDGYVITSIQKQLQILSWTHDLDSILGSDVNDEANHSFEWIVQSKTALQYGGVMLQSLSKYPEAVISCYLMEKHKSDLLILPKEVNEDIKDEKGYKKGIKAVDVTDRPLFERAYTYVCMRQINIDSLLRRFHLVDDFGVCML